jgi:hypothetical protein
MNTGSETGVASNGHDRGPIDGRNGDGGGHNGALPRAREPVGVAVEPSPVPSPVAPCGRVSVVIPAKNEAKNLAWVLLRMPPYVSEVILVDGESTDGTVAIATAALPDITIVQDPGRGKGAALRAGFAAATGDCIVMLDADGSMDPAEMTRFLAVLATGFELVKGSRFIAGGDSTDITGLRRFGNRVLRSTVNVLYRTRFSDLCYGYCAFRRSALPALGLRADGFEIETEISLHAVAAGLRVCEVPSFEAPRGHGTTSLRTFRDGERVLRTVVCERLRPRPPGRKMRRPDQKDPTLPLVPAGY